MKMRALVLAGLMAWPTYPISLSAAAPVWFSCSDTTNVLGWIHNDTEESGATYKDGFHFSQTTGQCDGFGTHSKYSDGFASANELKKAVDSNDDAKLVKFLLENRSAEINIGRGAIQLVNATGQVVAHQAVRPQTLGRVSDALQTALHH